MSLFFFFVFFVFFSLCLLACSFKMLSSLVSRSLLNVRNVIPLSQSLGTRLVRYNNNGNGNDDDHRDPPYEDPPPYIPDNNIETIIMRAATEPSARPEFYRKLLESTLYVINEDGGKEEWEGEGKRVAQKDEQFRVRCVGDADGRKWIPIFTSVKRMQDFKPSDGARYLGGDAKIIFQSMKDADFLLNPGSAYGKEMTRVEVQQLLSGELFQTENIHIKSGTEMVLGDPLEVPELLLKQLGDSFAGMSSVKNAYFAEFVNPDTNKVEGLLGVTCEEEGERENVLEMISIIGKGQDTGYEKPLVTVWLGAGGDVLDEFFQTKVPFYSKE